MHTPFFRSVPNEAAQFALAIVLTAALLHIGCMLEEHLPLLESHLLKRRAGNESVDVSRVLVNFWLRCVLLLAAPLKGINLVLNFAWLSLLATVYNFDYGGTELIFFFREFS